MGKWIVTQDYIRGVLYYLVEHSETGERKGTFDWQARKRRNNGDYRSLLFRAVPKERS